MKMKKSLIFMLVMLLSISLALAGCKSEDAATGKKEGTVKEDVNETGLPIVDKEITLTIAGSYDARTGSDWNNLETFKEINKDTNVKIDWKLTPGSDWAEKRNLMLASSDLPDVMLKLRSADIVKGGSQGIFIPLENLIDKYAPNLTKFLEENPEVKAAITAPDGHIYSVPQANMAEYKRASGNTLWINEKWLEKVGMEMPKTTAEFKAALEAFKAQDMNGNGKSDEVPLSGIYGDGLHGFDFLFGSFGTLNETFIVKNEKKVEFVRTSSEYKEVIKYLSSLYKDGLIDQEIFSMDEAALISKLSSSETASVGAFFGWSPDQITNTAYKWDYGSPIVALKGPKGDQARGYLNPQMDVAAFAITKVNEHPAATIRWIDKVFEPDMSFKLREGPNRIKKLDNGKIGTIPAPEGFTEGEWRVKETPYNSFPYGFSQEMREQMDLSELKSDHLDPDSDKWFELQKPNLKKWVYPSVLFTNEQYDLIGQYETDIISYTNEMAAKWVTGSSDIEKDWDKYVETLNQMGLKEYKKVYQDGLDTYLKNSK